MSDLYGENAVLMAPLSGYTDLPYRRAARRCSCRYAFTEMVDVSAVVYARERTLKMLRRGEDEDFLGAQLVGADEAHAREAVRILNDLDFNVLDLNMGCPVPKVTKKGAGAALGADPDRACRMMAILAENSRFPVTGKIRILDENDPAPTVALAQGLYRAGAQAITVHGRLKSAVYSGKVHAQIIRAVRESLSIPVIANGGIFTRADAERLRAESGCTRVMVARGIMGNFRLFRSLNGFGECPPTLEEFLEEMRLHVQDMLETFGPCVLPAARKIILDDLRGRGFSPEAKVLASGISTVAGWEEFCRRLPEYHTGAFAGEKPGDRLLARSVFQCR